MITPKKNYKITKKKPKKLEKKNKKQRYQIEVFERTFPVQKKNPANYIGLLKQFIYTKFFIK